MCVYPWRRYLLLPGALETEAFRKPNQSCKRISSHLAHNMTPVNLNRALGDFQFCCNLFVQQTADQQWQNVLLSGREGTIARQKIGLFKGFPSGVPFPFQSMFDGC
jgi:hypothetical protein